MKEFDKVNQLTESHGAWRPGKGVITCVIALGGHQVPVNDFANDTPYIGVDWFLHDLLGSTLIFIFIFIEKLSALRRETCTVVGDYVPNGFFRQLAFPFRWKG